MGYTISFARQAQSDLDRLTPQSAQRVYVAIAALADYPRPHGCKKLVNRQGWRIRVGSYRVICEINDDKLTAYHSRNEFSKERISSHSEAGMAWIVRLSPHFANTTFDWCEPFS